MSKTEDIDDIAGHSVAEMEQIAEGLYEHRDELGGDEVPVEQVSEVRSVVSASIRQSVLLPAERSGLPVLSHTV